MWKKITGIALLIITLLVVGCGSNTSSTNNKDVKNNVLTGKWFSTKKDKQSNVISNIMILEIKDDKNAHLTTWELKGNTFPNIEGNKTKILWQSTDFDLSVESKGKDVVFSVEEIGTVLECKHDKEKNQLIAKDDMGIFTRDEIQIQEIKKENIDAYKDFALKKGVVVDIEKDMTSNEYMEYVRKNTFNK